MPLPGTGSVKHLEENRGAANVVSDEAAFEELQSVG
jgi:aryl-alcohol dehydrogenase-like predicted oxidoreductase